MNMTTGEAIREARLKAGLTQKELAQKMGIPYQSIGQWENNKRNPKSETMERIASALDTTVFLLYNPHVANNVPPQYSSPYEFISEITGYSEDLIKMDLDHPSLVPAKPDYIIHRVLSLILRKPDDDDLSDENLAWIKIEALMPLLNAKGLTALQEYAEKLTENKDYLNYLE